MTTFESYMSAVDGICAKYFDLGDEGADRLDQLLAYAQKDLLAHSVKGYIEVKHPEVYADFFSYLWEDDQ